MVDRNEDEAVAPEENRAYREYCFIREYRTTIDLYGMENARAVFIDLMDAEDGRQRAIR